MGGRYLLWAVGTLLSVALIAAGAAHVARMRLEERHASFTEMTSKIAKGMSEQQMRDMLGEPTLTAEVPSPRVVGLGVDKCRDYGGKRVLAYRFEWRTWVNHFVPVSTSDWFSACVDESGRVIRTDRALVQY